MYLKVSHENRIVYACPRIVYCDYPKHQLSMSTTPEIHLQYIDKSAFYCCPLVASTIKRRHQKPDSKGVRSRRKMWEIGSKI